MKSNKWSAFQIIQLILFLAMSLFLIFRKVDGSGAENTSDVRLISLAVWLGFYLFLLVIEYGVRFLTRIGKK